MSEVVRFWIAHGMRIFRVDNPHTKPLRFWEWLIASVKARPPGRASSLSEAFTRPKVMYRLAKVGFSQSYTYFAWRTQKWELEQYLTELHSPPVAEFLRANLWPNTPDILTEQLQTGGRATFMARLILAGTLASSYGIYGPAFELQENRPRSPGSEEYLHSEKYEIRHWNLEDPRSLAPLVTAVNRIRRENAALRHDRNLEFHRTDNDQLIAYSRRFVNRAGDPDNTLVSGREPRSGLRPERLRRPRPGCPRDRRFTPVRGPRPAHRLDLHVERRPQLRGARPERGARPHLPDRARRSGAGSLPHRRRARIRSDMNVRADLRPQRRSAAGRTALARHRSRHGVGGEDFAHWYKDAVIYELHIQGVPGLRR